MTETARQPDGQWCWCDDPPEGQPPHDCAEDHATRAACQYDGAHVHPWQRRETGITRERAGPPASRITDADRRLVTRARELAAARDADALRVIAGSADSAGYATVYAEALGVAQYLLGELAAVIDRLDGHA